MQLKVPAVSRVNFRTIVLSVISVLLLCWAAFYNGQPYFFSDTTTYINAADFAVKDIFGFKTEWSELRSRNDIAREASASARRQIISLNSVKDKSVLSGRSIYYGFLLFIGNLISRLWVTVLIQAALVAAGIYMTLRALFLQPLQRTVIACAVLAVLSPISFYVSFLMPDVFAGLAILACANLLAFPGQLDRFAIFFWLVILSFSLMCHASHLLISAGFLLIGIIWAVSGKQRDRGRSALVIAAALLCAILAEFAFNFAVTAIVGKPPVRPPFLTAKFVYDGPGYRYMKETCPQNGYVICRFIDRLPLYVDSFIWSTSPENGVFAASDPKVRRLLSDEQIRFSLSVISYDPIGLTWASLEASWRQFCEFGLAEFNYSSDQLRYFPGKIPEEYLVTLRKTRAYGGRVPVSLFDWIVYAVAIGCSAYLIFNRLVLAKNADDRKKSINSLILLVVGGIVLNAVICGSLSALHDRYQARVIWLLPFVTLVYDFFIRSEWWDRMINKTLLSGR